MAKSSRLRQTTGFVGKTLDTALSWLRRLISTLFFGTVRIFLGKQRTINLRNSLTRYLERSSAYFNRHIDRNSRYYKTLSTFWKLALTGVFLAFFYLFCVRTNFLWLMGRMPSIEDLQNPKVAQASEIYSADSLLIRKFFVENRTTVKYEEISPNVIKALIATEDIRFYAHSGVDPTALGAVVAAIFSGRSERGGGSTITQQLAKNLFKTRRESSQGLLGRVPLLGPVIYKTKEWITAIRLERNFTKEEILTMYLNTVDYGFNAYGIKIAAKTYFNKPPDSLSIPDAAVLVGLQKATTTYNPVRNPKKSLERRNVVISQMAKYGFISRPERDSIMKLPLALSLNFDPPFDEANSSYYLNAVTTYLERWGEENGYDLYTDGLRIYTTIDSRMQAMAEEAVTEKMRQLQRIFEQHWLKRNPWVGAKNIEIPNFLNTVVRRTRAYKYLSTRFPTQPDSVNFYLNKKDTMTVFDWENAGSKKVYWSTMDSLNYYKRILRAGLMAMDPMDGRIRAWVGDLDYAFFKYDHVRQGRRQPGSTFKPFAYVAAIDDSAYNMAPCDVMEDVPVRIEYIEDDSLMVWEPKNSTGIFTYDEMSLRRALAQSVNSVTAQLTEKITPATVLDYAKRLGISTAMKPMPSIGLGPFDVSLYDMVAAYACFMNGGNYTSPILISRIEDRNGNTIEDFRPETRPAISKESAFLMRSMLKGTIEEPGGTSRGLWAYDIFKKRNDVGGKTGTTSNNSDGWYMCVTQKLVTGAWVGGDDRSIHFRSTRLGEGSKTALPLVGRFLEKVYQDKSLGNLQGPFEKPNFKINKKYNCPTPVYQIDTTLNSLLDSLRRTRSLEPLGPPPPEL